jgi:hypothetical protein
VKGVLGPLPLDCSPLKRIGPHIPTTGSPVTTTRRLGITTCGSVGYVVGLLLGMRVVGEPEGAFDVGMRVSPAEVGT